jgi:hypothetical protein
VFLGPWLAGFMGVVVVLALCGAAELAVSAIGFRAAPQTEPRPDSVHSAP